MSLKGQLNMFGQEQTGNEEYQEFVSKFTDIPKTTDDCYTPENVYEAIVGWVSSEYGIARENMVRPFWPGGDYKSFDYQPESVVVDNPPFSILAEIQRFYTKSGISFFLFAPTLTLFSSKNPDVTYISCGVSITYENKARVNTSFVTNLDTCRVRSAPGLYQIVQQINEVNERKSARYLPKYIYPDYVLTPAEAYQYSRCGIEYRLEKKDCVPISALDSQKKENKAIFGTGFLLNERAASEHAAAERAVAEQANIISWALSDREWGIIRELGKEVKV